MPSPLGVAQAALSLWHMTARGDLPRSRALLFLAVAQAARLVLGRRREAISRPMPCRSQAAIRALASG